MSSPPRRRARELERPGRCGGLGSVSGSCPGAEGCRLGAMYAKGFAHNYNPGARAGVRARISKLVVRQHECFFAGRDIRTSNVAPLREEFITMFVSLIHLCNKLKPKKHARNSRTRSCHFISLQTNAFLQKTILFTLGTDNRVWTDCRF